MLGDARGQRGRRPSAMLGWGMYIGSRRELIWTLRHRAERAEAEQELRVAQARSNERARIAREMHDVLAHRISQISMHAGALAFRDGPRPPTRCAPAPTSSRTRRTRRSPTCAASSACCATPRPASAARAAAADVRRPAASWSTRPAGAGLQRRRTTTGVERGRPRCRTRSAARVYRIVQEGMTNAAQARPRRSCSRVQVSGSPEDGVDVRAAQPARRSRRRARPGAGLGLVGLTERAELRGGRLEARPRGRRRSCCAAGYRGRHDRRRSGPRSSTTTRWCAPRCA